MKYRYFQWGVTMLLLASAILNIHTDGKRRELNQRYKRLIEQKEAYVKQLREQASGALYRA